jgi:hypothetical protein
MKMHFKSDLSCCSIFLWILISVCSCTKEGIAKETEASKLCEGSRESWTGCIAEVETVWGSYKGEFRDGFSHGLGVNRYSRTEDSFTWQEEYIGNFEAGHRTGEGVYIYLGEDGPLRNSGAWLNGVIFLRRSIQDFVDKRTQVFVLEKIQVVEDRLRKDLAQRKKQEEAAAREQIEREYEQTYGPALEKCRQLGFKKGTDKFADCVLRLSK